MGLSARQTRGARSIRRLGRLTAGTTDPAAQMLRPHARLRPRARRPVDAPHVQSRDGPDRLEIRLRDRRGVGLDGAGQHGPGIRRRKPGERARRRRTRLPSPTLRPLATDRPAGDAGNLFGWAGGRLGVSLGSGHRAHIAPQVHVAAAGTVSGVWRKAIGENRPTQNRAQRSQRPQRTTRHEPGQPPNREVLPTDVKYGNGPLQRQGGCQAALRKTAWTGSGRRRYTVRSKHATRSGPGHADSRAAFHAMRAGTGAL